MFRRAQKHVGVIELAAHLLGNQPGLRHGLERAERASVPKSGVLRPVRQLKPLRQRNDLIPRPLDCEGCAAPGGTRTADTTP